MCCVIRRDDIQFSLCSSSFQNCGFEIKVTVSAAFYLLMLLILSCFWNSCSNKFIFDPPLFWYAVPSCFRIELI